MNSETEKINELTTEDVHANGGERIEKSGEKGEKGGSGIATNDREAPKNVENERKSPWWPSCYHSRYTKLAVRKFRDRIVILWKCRKCPKQVREVIDIDMNSRNVFVRSTNSAMPRQYDSPPE